jgi:hypothetical protein
VESLRILWKGRLSFLIDNDLRRTLYHFLSYPPCNYLSAARNWPVVLVGGDDHSAVAPILGFEDADAEAGGEAVACVDGLRADVAAGAAEANPAPQGAGIDRVNRGQKVHGVDHRAGRHRIDPAHPGRVEGPAAGEEPEVEVERALEAVSVVRGEQSECDFEPWIDRGRG